MTADIDIQDCEGVRAADQKGWMVTIETPDGSTDLDGFTDADAALGWVNKWAADRGLLPTKPWWVVQDQFLKLSAIKLT